MADEPSSHVAFKTLFIGVPGLSGLYGVEPRLHGPSRPAICRWRFR
jgi:hypothetical protein